MEWQKLKSLDQLIAIKEASTENPVLIFKHSTRCAVSHLALARLEREWKQEEMKGVKPFYLDLLANRELSDRLAEDFSVLHESPQVLLIANGQSVYNRSHASIRYRDLLAFTTKRFRS